MATVGRQKEGYLTLLQALGRTGLVLLGAYFILAGALGIAASIVRIADVSHGMGEAFSYEPQILISIAAPHVVGSIVPGLVLLLGRRWLARKLFRGPAEGELRVDGEAVVITGFVLLGTLVAIDGVNGLVYAVSGIIMLPERFSGSFAAGEMKVGLPVALVRIAIGVVLVAGAPRIAKWL
jgi:hypothetical protein